MTVLYVPAPHTVQLPPLATLPVNPAAQPQLLASVADTALSGQLMHAIEPVTDLYVPAAHATQPASPVNPALQSEMQSDANVLAWSDSEFVGHEEQPAAPAESLNVLAGHAAQVPPAAASPA